MSKINDSVIRILRTVTPALGGSLLSWAAQTLGWVNVPEELEAQVSGLLFLLFTGGWYIFWSWVEKKVPALGAFNGFPAQPKYHEEDKGDTVPYQDVIAYRQGEKILPGPNNPEEVLSDDGRSDGSL